MYPDLTQYTWIVWIGIAVVCLVLEVISLHFLFLMIAAGSIIGGLGGLLLGFPAPVQLLCVALISGLLIFTIRPLLYRLLVAGRPRELTNVDALAGMTAKATVAFADGAGFARLANGETWTARLDAAHEAAAVAPGGRLVVVAIDGATAVVAPSTADSTVEPALPNTSPTEGM